MGLCRRGNFQEKKIHKELQRLQPHFYEKLPKQESAQSTI